MQQDSGSDGAETDVSDRLGALLSEVEARLEEGFSDEALILAQQAQRLLERHPKIASDLRIDTHYLLASCQFEQRDVLAALREYEQVRRIDASDAELDYWQARALFHVWRFDEAHALLRSFRADSNTQTRAGSIYYRALIEDFRGEKTRAEGLFRRAEEEDPDEFPMPQRHPREELEGMLQETVLSLPEHVRRAIQHVQIELLSLPDPQVHGNPQLDPLVLGLCKRRGERGRGPNGVAFERDGIEIYQRNLERVCSDGDELREELRLTVLHEIGHQLERTGHTDDRREPLN